MRDMSPEAVEVLRGKGEVVKAASRYLSRLSTEVRNQALLNIADDLISRQEGILEANRLDYEEAQASGMAAAMLDRLLLTPERLEGIASDVRVVAALPDPVGEVFDVSTRPNGLIVGKKRVPIGVIGAIYESRPNVTVDISALCLKSGNGILLRGGKEALRSNSALVRVIQDAVSRSDVPWGAVQFIESTERALVNEMLKMNDIIDLIVPRGGAELIRLVTENATMPVVSGGIGVCHTYIDFTANPEKAINIAYNAKVQRPTVCNALDCLLVHSEIAPYCLPVVARGWSKAGVELRCDERALEILQKAEEPDWKLVPAQEDDWGYEFLSLVAAVKVVDSLDDALEHIERYGSGHSEAIVTEDYSAAMRFLDEIDAACVYVNASTRFTDGGQFGLGAEVGISTQKLHARGPMGLKELTTYKWIIFGSGQVRP